LKKRGKANGKKLQMEKKLKSIWKERNNEMGERLKKQKLLCDAYL
jgi:hypothetical protein